MVCEISWKLDDMLLSHGLKPGTNHLDEAITLLIAAMIIYYVVVLVIAGQLLIGLWGGPSYTIKWVSCSPFLLVD